MRTFQLNKLVRDGILPDMQSRGQEVRYRVLEDDTEYRGALLAKLREELGEYEAAQTEEDRMKELTDIYGVLEALATLDGESMEGASSLNEARKVEMGGFAGRIFVETVGVQDGDSFGDYYASDPNRFPEE
jgi:predicted house-cleaning noncanonical NTP pyrophosphatase (MazG superfamily)